MKKTEEDIFLWNARRDYRSNSVEVESFQCLYPPCSPINCSIPEDVFPLNEIAISLQKICHRHVEFSLKTFIWMS